jgi:branched-chain amino acid transport system substrate-binding protein
LKRVAVIFHDDEWSGIIAPSFVHEFEEKGGEIVMQERVAVGESDFKTIIQKAKGLSPDGVYLPFVPVNTDIFLKQAKEMDLNAQILSGDALIPEIVQAAGSTAEGIYFTNIYDGDNEVSNKLKGLYFREFGHEPSELPIVSFGYDAVQVIKKAIENTSTQTPKEIAAALRSINIFGAGGWIKMDSNCLANRVEKIYQIRDGNSVLIKED